MISTEVKVTKVLSCDNCGWECDNSECCPMDGKVKTAEVRRLHPEFAWASDKIAFCEDCSYNHVCMSCGDVFEEEIERCNECEEWYCQTCFDANHSNHTEEFI